MTKPTKQTKNWLTQAAYAAHRKAHGLPGGTRSSVNKAIKAGRVSANSAGLLNPSIADAAWRHNTQMRMPSPTSRPQPSPHLDGLDDGWLAAYAALQAFVLRHGIDRFGATLVALLFAMPLEAAARTPGNDEVEDAWEDIEAEYERLVAGG